MGGSSVQHGSLFETNKRLSLRRVRPSRQKDRHDHQPIYPAKVVRIAGKEREVVRDGYGCNHCIGRASRRLASRASQRSCHPAKLACGLDIKWKRIKIGLGELQVSLSRGALEGVYHP